MSKTNVSKKWLIWLLFISCATALPIIALSNNWLTSKAPQGPSVAFIKAVDMRLWQQYFDGAPSTPCLPELPDHILPCTQIADDEELAQQCGTLIPPFKESMVLDLETVEDRFERVIPTQYYCKLHAETADTLDMRCHSKRDTKRRYLYDRRTGMIEAWKDGETIFWLQLDKQGNIVSHTIKASYIGKKLMINTIIDHHTMKNKLLVYRNVHDLEATNKTWLERLVDFTEQGEISSEPSVHPQLSSYVITQKTVANQTQYWRNSYHTPKRINGCLDEHFK